MPVDFEAREEGLLVYHVDDWTGPVSVLLSYHLTKSLPAIISKWSRIPGQVRNFPAYSPKGLLLRLRGHIASNY